MFSIIKTKVKIVMNTPNYSFVDLQPLKNEIDGNLKVCKMLIDTFLVDIDVYMNAMSTEINYNKLPEIYQVAHKIIPSIRIFSIKKLEPIILQLESELKKEKDLDLINKNIKSSLEIFNQVKMELQNELKLIENAAK